MCFGAGCPRKLPRNHPPHLGVPMFPSVSALFSFGGPHTRGSDRLLVPGLNFRGRSSVGPWAVVIVRGCSSEHPDLTTAPSIVLQREGMAWQCGPAPSVFFPESLAYLFWTFCAPIRLFGIKFTVPPPRDCHLEDVKNGLARDETLFFFFGRSSYQFKQSFFSMACPEYWNGLPPFPPPPILTLAPIEP